MKFPKSLLLTATVLLAGCGVNEVEEKVAPAGPPPVKAMLEGVAQTGELGSGAMEIREGIEKLDGPKAEELKNDLAELEKATTPEEVKAKAKAMADKL